ncbi:hypothetical protein [Streptomyces sp. HPF1205]|uniref:hypothetical protein n=1 Tax=Streptomyces sp. HPF1205 TaxID=2873262 RepID=UPI001CECC1D7|nr:hypothetical protein [Streptomyces sp. HPF1205]
MPRRPWHRTAVRTAVAALAAAGLLTAAGLGSTARATGEWRQTGSGLQSSLGAGEGVTTVQRPGGGERVLYRGVASIPPALRLRGWSHIGDPDSARGYVVDAYQSRGAAPTRKMFRVTTPSGRSYEYTHTLAPGEMYNNSFAAVSPDTRWMVAGEWGVMDHLQVYPTPLLNPATARTGGGLALSGLVRLDKPVGNVQGCDFVTATELVCASDDSSLAYFPEDKPLLRIDLEHPLSGGDVAGHVTDLGPIPQDSECAGASEAEGVDYDATTGVLRVEMIQPSVCAAVTTVYRFRRG